MVDLVFDCVGGKTDRFAMTPGLILRIKITETGGEPIDAIALRCQIRIEPQLRRYSAAEADRLHDLFGEPERWTETLQPMQLATVSTMVPGFTGTVTIDLPLPVSYDLEIASTKYLHGVTDGVVPLLLLYSGTVFCTLGGRMQVQQVPWSKECSYGLPVQVWRETVDLHFPNSAWLRVHRETLDALQRFKSRNALPSWDSTLVALLDLV